MMAANTKNRCLTHILMYLVFALLVLLLCPLVGSEKINLSEALNIDSVQGQILWQLRVPRVLLGFIAGGTLALVGSVFQVVLRNPLATPYTLGVTGGAATGAYIAIAFPAISLSVGLFSSVQILALAGAAAVLMLIYMIARRQGGVSMTTLLLAGVTIGILCGAFILMIRYLTNPNLLVSMDRWVMGALDTVGYRDIGNLLPFVLAGAGMLFLQMSSLNHISFGEELAMGHGVDVLSVQRYCFIGGSVATAGVVSMVGPIAFVGLIVPHTIRRMSGYDHRIILPGTFLVGGGFLVLCDTIARVVISPSEMPVGIITALLGGPFFIYLLFKRR